MGKADTVPGGKEAFVHLRLYLAGQAANSQKACARIHEACAKLQPDSFKLEIIDVLNDSGRDLEQSLRMVPTLVRVAPLPVRRISGDLDDSEEVLRLLGLLAESRPARPVKAADRLAEAEGSLQALSEGKIDYLLQNGNPVPLSPATHGPTAGDLLASFLNDTEISIAYLDRDFNYIFVNPTFAHSCGRSPDDFCGKNHFALFPISEVQVIFREVVFLEKPFYALSSPFSDPENPQLGITYWDWFLEPVRNAEGAVVGVMLAALDVTRRRQSEIDFSEVQRRLLDSTENERLRLAQYLHDGPIQDLYGADFQLHNLEERLAAPDDRKTMDEVQTTLHEVIRMLQETCNDLRPSTLAPFGLEKSIRSYAEHFQDAHPQIQVSLNLMNDGQALPEALRLGLFRIYQHVMSNVARHANAHYLEVRFWMDDEEVVLEVEDDGCGFGVPERWVEFVRTGRLGLAGAAERAEAFGGRLEIQSRPEQGTLIRTIIPRKKIAVFAENFPSPSSW